MANQREGWSRAAAMSMREVEIKLKLRDPPALRSRLRALAARCAGTVLEYNAIFDTRDARLRRQGRGLRVRQTRPAHAAGPTECRLTFKGPREPGEQVRARQELETDVGSATIVTRILEQLGFAPRIEYEKARESWTLDDCEIVIDQLPRLGWFCEIEGPAPDAVLAMRSRLGFSADDQAPETYVELAARHGTPGPDGVVRLRFET